MSVELKQRAADAVELAKAGGAQDAWATASQSRDVEFQYRDGALEKVKDTTSRNLSIRVYAYGRYSSHQTTDLNPERLRSFIAEAVAITKALEPDEYREITPEALFQNRPDVDLDLVDDTVQALDREQRMRWCTALDEAAHQHERVISATAGVYDGTSMSASASSNGFLGEQRSTYCWLGSEVTLKDQGEKRAEDWFYAGGATDSPVRRPLPAAAYPGLAVPVVPVQPPHRQRHRREPGAGVCDCRWQSTPPHCQSQSNGATAQCRPNPE